MGSCANWGSGWRCCQTNESWHQTAGGGAVGRMKPPIRLLAEPKSIGSIFSLPCNLQHFIKLSSVF